MRLFRKLRLGGCTYREYEIFEVLPDGFVAQMNVPPAKWGAKKHIFQITYNEQLGLTRAELLRCSGYAVISVVGNDKAKLLLDTIKR